MLNRMLRKRIKLTAMLFGWVEKGFTVIFADFVIVNVLVELCYFVNLFEPLFFMG